VFTFRPNVPRELATGHRDGQFALGQAILVDGVERFFAALAMTGFVSLIACTIWIMLQ
jgi:hypothetical protein